MTDRVGLFFQHYPEPFTCGAPVGGGARRADSAGVLPCHVIGESGTLGRQSLLAFLMVHEVDQECSCLFG